MCVCGCILKKIIINSGNLDINIIWMRSKPKEGIQPILRNWKICKKLFLSQDGWLTAYNTGVEVILLLCCLG